MSMRMMNIPDSRVRYAYNPLNLIWANFNLRERGNYICHVWNDVGLLRMLEITEHAQSTDVYIINVCVGLYHGIPDDPRLGAARWPVGVSDAFSPGSTAFMLNEKRRGFICVFISGWYFEKMPLGFVLGMMGHEIGLHRICGCIHRNVAQEEALLQHMTIASQSDDTEQDMLAGLIGTTRFMEVPTRGARREHMYASVLSTDRGLLYLQLIVELCQRVLQTNAGFIIPAGESTVARTVATDILRCYLIDIRLNLATCHTSDLGIMNLRTIQRMASIYNLRRQTILTRLTSVMGLPDLVPIVPPQVTPFDLIRELAGVIGHVAAVLAGGTSGSYG